MHDITEMTTEELVAESKRLTALKVWGPTLDGINNELNRRRPVELAQDAYYYGTAADLRSEKS